MNGKTKLYFNNNNKSCIDRTNKSSRRSFNDIYENNRRNSYINHASTILEENNDKKSAKEVAYSINCVLIFVFVVLNIMKI